MYAEVILSKAIPKLDKIYHYSIPQALIGKIQIGSQVLIPFGNRKDFGYVVGFIDKAEVKKVKDIIDLTSEIPLFNEKSVELAKWLSEYYLSYFITSLRSVMPPGTIRKEHRTQSTEHRIRRISGEKTEKSIVEPIEIGKPLTPTPDQEKALYLIKQSIDQGKHDTILLYGITGSGKTEVYLQAVAHATLQGKSSIILVPEIGMTPQMLERFRSRFSDHLAIIHSDMTIKKRDEEWGRLLRGEASIVLGTRSAILAPVRNLGLIVIDEEYEVTYKQEKNPRYHARTVALKLAADTSSTLVMGSATPSIETFYRAQRGEYKVVTLPKRIDERPLPEVEIIDMRKEKGWTALSKKLRDAIKETLSRGEQVILFINRRGFFTFSMCRECGYALLCPKCSVSLTYHSKEGKLRCNHCGFIAEASVICPKCNSSSIAFFGVGTQRIESEVAEIYPEAKILRVDRDTVKKRGSHDVIFSAFKEGKANVLIGTQMVTKGLDIAKVTLVGVVSADTILRLPDFRASEHTFQLLTQVAGRAGRHSLPGQVIIQTFDPDHYAIKNVIKHDYESFYREEIKFREELKYPPFYNLINIVSFGEDESRVIKVIRDIKNLLSRRLPESLILGEAPAPIAKRRGNFRYEILLKGEDLGALRKAVVESLEKVVILEGVRVSADVEPMNML
ncbi:MAG: primosomal protein N' [Candidatus Saganbacteria bacterium]|nr:primosomal protein N' [Candidatus Saganbacteria bacterium]